MEDSLACKLFILLFLVCSLAIAQETPHGELAGVVLDVSGGPLPGARIVCKNEASGVEVSAETDAQGAFSMQGLAGGRYLLSASLDGFQTVTVTIPSLPSRKLELILPLQKNLQEEVTVTSDEPLLQKDDAQKKERLDDAVLDYAPLASQRFQDALPLVPSVVRGPDGNINMSGARASENGLLLNGANVTDPVTGNFAIDLPIEAVETVDVYTNPYSSEFGRFTGGVTSVSTRGGEDRFKAEVNDFIPRLHFVDGLKTEGVEAWLPRIRLSGPTGIDHLYYSQAFQYKYLRTFIEDLPGDPATKITAFDSLTQFDYRPTEKNQWSFTASIFPQDTDNVLLNTFLPVPSTPDFRQRGFGLAVSNRRFFSDGSYLESLAGYKSYNVSVLPKDETGSPFEIAPEGMSGSFFNFQDRDSSRIQWTEILALRPVSWLGSHQLKAGLEVGRSEFAGRSTYDTIEVRRLDGSLAEVDAFDGPGLLSASQGELGTFLQDRWSLSDEWTVDAGLRVDDAGAAGDWNAAPRFAFVYAPKPLPNTTIKGGAGIFYDKVYLNAYEFDQYPVRTVTEFNEQGDVIETRRLQPFRSANFKTPSGITSNLAVEQVIASRLLLRVNFMIRQGNDQFVVEPARDALLLTQNGQTDYKEWEITTRYRISKESQLFFSYVHSSARGDLNDFDTYFGNFQKPLIRQNAFAYLPFDATHRFLSWGVLELPWKVFLSPVLEIRDGFRYSAVNQLQDYVGERNSLRFPVFAQLDLRITRTFQVFKKYNVMLGLKVFNAMNRFNPRDVQNNIDSPAFGTFYNGVDRTYRAAFEIQY